MFLRTRLFFFGVLLFVCAAVFLGILLYRAKKPQEPIIIYKTVMPETRATSGTSEKPAAPARTTADETDPVLPHVDSDLATDFVDLMPVETQLPVSDVQIEGNIVSDDMGVSNVSEPEEERFLGRTLAEIEAEIPVLEREIRTNLTKAVELYADLRRTDGMARKSPEIAAWRDETWAEVKRLFHDMADTGKILTYISYLKVTGRENPMNPGGWLSDLMEPLPMRVSVNFN